MVRRCRNCAFPIALGLNVMLTGVDRRLLGTCWSALICFWRDIFEPYMPPYMSLCFGIVERCCDHTAIERAIHGWGFSLFISSFLSFSLTFSSFLGFFFHFIFFLRLFLPFFLLS